MDDETRQQEQERRRENSPVESYLKRRALQAAQKQILQFLVRQGALTAARSAVTAVGAAIGPWGWAIVGIIVFLIVIIIILFMNHDTASSLIAEPPPPVTPPGQGGTAPTVQGVRVTKTGDIQVEIGENIIYRIRVDYDASAATDPADKIVILDNLPSNVEFVSATGTYVRTGNTLEWPLNASQSAYLFSLVVKPLTNDSEVVNTAFARSLVAPDRTIDANAANLEAVFVDAGRVANVPHALLKAIARTESGVMGYSALEFDQFNEANWWTGRLDNAPNLDDNDPLILRGYAYNTCQYVQCAPGSDVRGAMQFELATWNGFKPRLAFADGHDPDRRYVRDIIYAAAYFIRDKIDLYDDRFNFTANLNSLNETQVKALAKSYCGGNPDANTNDPACGYGAHEASVWEYYQMYNSSTDQNL